MSSDLINLMILTCHLDLLLLNISQLTILLLQGLDLLDKPLVHISMAHSEQKVMRFLAIVDQGL